MDFQAPAPRTQAGFLFFGTELLNPCMWATDSDFLQADYVTGNNKMVADCPDCKVTSHVDRNVDNVGRSASSFYRNIPSKHGSKLEIHLCPWLGQAHRGFLKAFNSITNSSDPQHDIAAAWTEMTGVPANEVTS